MKENDVTITKIGPMHSSHPKHSSIKAQLNMQTDSLVVGLGV